jgi:hypothetical protein
MKKILITTIILFTFTITAYSAPFSDISSKHWAYKSVMKLAKNNLVDSTNSFKGNKNITRYDLAKLIARLMEIKKWNGNKKFNQLTIEFSDELSLLGVKINSLEKDLKKINSSQNEFKKILNEKKYNYRVTMESRFRFEENNYDTNNTVPASIMDNKENYIRTRFNIKAKIDNNIS